jgi:hypothetical protein
MVAKRGSFSVSLMFASLLILASCDPGSVIKYQIENKTKATFVVKYQFPGDSLQTFVNIAPGSNKIIKKQDRLGYVDDANRRIDSIYFHNFEVKAGDKISLKNFKDKKYWRFKKDDYLHASYILTIDSSFFN